MSVLKSNFVAKHYESPVLDDFQRVVDFDEDGNEFVSYQKVDYPSLVATRGEVGAWQLDSLLKAGVNPNFPIRTGLNTRLEGIGVVNDAVATLDSMISEDNNVEKS